MIEVQPYSDHAAMSVLKNLDPMDQIEAELIRGGSATHLAIFADWRAVNGMRLISSVLSVSGRPFAVLALGHTGQAGVAQAALLSRSHQRFRRPLLEVARRIRREMPAICEEWGVHRIEARAWSGHPRAGRFLRLCGFHLEAEMPGFGADGSTSFHQYAWISPKLSKGET